MEYPINLDYPNQELFVGLMNPNLKPFFRDDQRTIILPIDHGTNIPVPDMPAFEGLISDVSEFVDGFVMNLGAAKVFAGSLDNKGLCLRTDNYKPDNPTGSYKVCGGDEAEAVAADGMMHMLYPGHENESIITMECAETIAEGLDEDIGVIVESLPFGLGMTDLYTAENIGFAVRQAAELGADVVKTASPTDASLDEFKAIIDACFVPVIVLGGAAMGDDEALLSMVRNALDAGAVGIAIGRNVWQHESPARIAQRLFAVVHDDASVAQALKIG